jgi:hypothetical protein
MDSVERQHLKQDARTLANAEHHEDADPGDETEWYIHTNNHSQADRLMSHGWVSAIDHADRGDGYEAPLTETGLAIGEFYETASDEERALIDSDPERFVERATREE